MLKINKMVKRNLTICYKYNILVKVYNLNCYFQTGIIHKINKTKKATLQWSKLKLALKLTKRKINYFFSKIIPKFLFYHLLFLNKRKELFSYSEIGTFLSVTKRICAT